MNRFFSKKIILNKNINEWIKFNRNQKLIRNVNHQNKKIIYHALCLIEHIRLMKV